MHENLNIVRDLALILISAGFITILFKYLKQPLILGYIVAGFLVGPHFELFPDVVGTDTVSQWSEIGIIFLLFSLGLEFSFKKLMKVGGSAAVTALVIFVGMFSTGSVVGQLMGWSFMESLFLGGILSMSSTTIIVKAFGDLGLKKYAFTSSVLGTLVIEDMIAVLLMVLFSTIAVSQEFSGSELLMKIFSLGFFLVLTFLIGTFVLPTILKRMKSKMNDEVLLVLSIGMCFGMVSLAEYAGFSAALGAFLMGSLMSETILGHKTEKVTTGVKDLFGAIFFVSVGMMIDPAILVEYWQPILILTLVVIIGMCSFATLGTLLSGKSLRVAVQSGFSLTQIGEFGFILAGLGVSLGVVREFVYPVIIAVSVITTFTTPYFIKMSFKVCDILEARLPERLQRKLEAYSTRFQGGKKPGMMKAWLQSAFLKIGLYSVIFIAITFVMPQYFHPFIIDTFEKLPNVYVDWITIFFTLLFMFPFMMSMLGNGGKSSIEFHKLWIVRSNKPIMLSIAILRIVIVLGFFVSIFLHYFSPSWWLVGIILLTLVLFFYIVRSNMSYLGLLEDTFHSNMNQKEDMEKAKNPLPATIKEKLDGYNIHLDTVEVSPDSVFVGRSLGELNFRQEYGVNVVKIFRGRKFIFAPMSNELIFPHDKLVVMGTDEQILKFSSVMEHKEGDEYEMPSHDVDVMSYKVGEESCLHGQTVVGADVRRSGCIIIGVERGNLSIMNPDPDFVFEKDDLVWMVGEKENCESLATCAKK